MNHLKVTVKKIENEKDFDTWHIVEFEKEVIIGGITKFVDVYIPDTKVVIEQKSLEKIQERGGASVGDKTMVDAMAPAVQALKASADKGLLEMLKAAEAAAKEGMENTKNCIAKFGKAKSLGERALGYQDAGATSVALIFEAMREFVEG